MMTLRVFRPGQQIIFTFMSKCSTWCGGKLIGLHVFSKGCFQSVQIGSEYVSSCFYLLSFLVFIYICIYLCSELYRNIHSDPDVKNLSEWTKIIESWSFNLNVRMLKFSERSDWVRRVRVLRQRVRLGGTAIRIKCWLVLAPKRRVSNSKKPSRGARRRRRVHSICRCGEYRFVLAAIHIKCLPVLAPKQRVANSKKHSRGARKRRLVVHFIRRRGEYQHVLPVITYHQVFSRTSCQETRFELNRRPNWSAAEWIHSTLQSHEVFSCVGC